MLDDGALVFDKSKSIWKDFIEDTPEYLTKMLDKDLYFGKTNKLMKER